MAENARIRGQLAASNRWDTKQDTWHRRVAAISRHPVFDMDTAILSEWQIRDESNQLVMPWWAHPFVAVLRTWCLDDKSWLEFPGRPFDRMAP